MIDGARVLALVPARSGSKGLPGKNIRPLSGVPLLAWPVAAALASRYVDRVVASTDSTEYAEIARQHGAEVPVLRPAELASDQAPTSSAVLHMLDQLASQGDQFEYFVLLEPTSPLTAGADIDAALEALLARRDVADAILGVSELSTSHPAFAVRRDPSSGRIEPYLGGDFGNLPRRQDLEPVFSLDGSLYISDVRVYREHRGFCHARTLGHTMPRYKSLEVDDLVDFLCIQALIEHMKIVPPGTKGIEK
jgi:N-acylneuraminate cytidylyltransferase/CMP-N,N'-diacetyllegionaminic acid synthase